MLKNILRNLLALSKQVRETQQVPEDFWGSDATPWREFEDRGFGMLDEVKDDDLKLTPLIESLLNTADQAGCSPDLVVVSAKELHELVEAAGLRRPGEGFASQLF